METSKKVQLSMTLRTKLAIAFLIVALVPLAILAWLNNHATETALTSAANQTLFAAASESVTALDTFLNTNINAIRTIAQLPRVVEYTRLPLGERPGSQGLRDVFTTLKNNDSHILTHMILDKKGESIMVGYGTDEFSIAFDKSDNNYFRVPFNTGEPFISGVKFLENRDPVLYFSIPVRDVVGNIVGVLVRVYDATILQDLVTRDQVLVQSFVTLTDENQFYLAHSTQPEYVLKFVAPPEGITLLDLKKSQRLLDIPNEELFLEFHALKQKLVENKNESYFSIADITPNGKVHQVAIAKLENQPWTVAFYLPQEVFLTPIREQNKDTILLVAIIAITVIVVAAVVTQFLTKPIIHLTDIAQEIIAGNLSRQAHVKSNDEIGILALTFNKMTTQLQTLISNLEAHVIDLTRTQAELEESKQELENKNKRLEEMDKLKDEFLANTSHELRTPLNGIIGLTESMLDGATGILNTVQSRNLSMVANSGKRLATLINNILDFSKLKHKSLTLQVKPIYLYPVIDVVLTLSEPLLASKPVELINKVDSSLLPVYGDENRVQQILYNLIGNAIKFTETGHVIVSTKTDENYITITISDTGTGIHADKLSHIFQAFEQADGSVAREYGGTGLGLAVTRQLVELHGGTVSVDSILGEGSSFYFTLPISNELPEDVGTYTSGRHGDSPEKEIIPAILEGDEITIGKDVLSAVKGDFHILVVDDEPVNLQVLINHLMMQNYFVTAASNGLEALDMIKKNEAFDLIVLDVMMPRMSGYDVCKEIRRYHSPIDLPIILLTAKNQVGDLLTGFNMGANDYLVKPFSKVELLARIKSHLQLNDMRKLNASKDRFFSIVAHDLKGPFQPLIGLSELLGFIADSSSPEEIKEMAYNIHRSAKNVYELLESLLEWARMQMGRMPFEPARLDLKKIGDDVIQLLTTSATEKWIVFENNVTADIILYADEYMTNTIIRNLTTNALKFTLKGGKITISAKELSDIEVDSENESSFVEILVSDTGIGIKEENIDKLFKIDVHHTTLGTQKEKGTGLGLIMCQEMVENHGGKIWVESEYGKGTTVKFTMPCYDIKNAIAKSCKQ